MPELGLGNVVYLLAVSYGMGVMWYTVLGRTYANWMRMAAFPLLGAIIGEALWITLRGIMWRRPVLDGPLWS